MDIQINAAQGRGKSTLARAIANTQGGIIYEAQQFSGAHINLTKIARDIVEARADVVIFDDLGGWDGWSIESVKGAVQAARQSLRRNIVAIYCVLDGNASANNSSQAFIPFGFVNAGAQPLEDAEPVRNTFKDNLHKYASGCKPLAVQALDPKDAADLVERWKAAHENVTRVHDEIVVDGITEQSIGTVKSYTSDILMDMARTINSYGRPEAVGQLLDVYKHFNVDGIAVLPPVFFATAHELILPIWQDVITRLREECVKYLRKAQDLRKGLFEAMREAVRGYASKLSEVSDKDVPTLYSKLVTIYGTK